MKRSDIASVRPKIRSKNTEKLNGEPLERRTIRFEDRDGIERYYPALHIKFSHAMVFVKFSAPPMKTIADSHLTGQDLANNPEIQKWFADVNNFEEMAKTLLSLQHNQFWSTLIYERSFQISLESYLRSAPRDHELYNSLITNEMKTCLKRVHNLIFRLYHRICSFVETKTNYISENTFGALLYDNYLIDFPKMIDLSVLYVNTECHQLLAQMLSTVIGCQPRFEEDLLKGCAHFKEMFNSIEQRLGTDENEDEYSNKISCIQWSELQTIIANIAELSASLKSLALSLPQMINYYKKSSIDKMIVEFYNRLFPILQNELNSRFESSDSRELISERIERQLLIARLNFVQTFRHIITNYFVDRLMDPNTKRQLKIGLIDELIETFTSISFEKNFVSDYCNQYSIETDLEALSTDSDLTQFQSLDKTRVDYLKTLIQSNASNELKTKINNDFSDRRDSPPIEEQVNGFSNIVEMTETDVALESQIQYIREIMPELGAGFVQQCLQFYHLDNEKVLNAILEDNLPPQLSSLDRSLAKVPQKQTNLKKVVNTEPPESEDNNRLPQTVPQVIDDRKNIYNNDEFDIFRNKNIDLNRIHLGKKEKTVSKIDVKTREKIMSLHYKALEEEEENEELCYDDEFDDTYEDDTKIDLIADKLMDELNVKPEDESQQTNSNSNKEMPKKTHYSQKPRNYR